MTCNHGFSISTFAAWPRLTNFAHSTATLTINRRFAFEWFHNTNERIFYEGAENHKA